MLKTNLVLGIMLIILLALSTNLMAADQIVDNNADAGVGTTLREAIADVHDGGIITFNISGSDIVTIASELSISSIGMTINGYNNTSGNNVTVQVTTPGTSTYRVFNINASGKTVNISNMTIKGGDIYSAGNYEPSHSGGGLSLIAGTLNLNTVTVSGSKASLGGGINIVSTGATTLTMTNTTVENNIAEWGGGIYQEDYSAASLLTIDNSTISGNTAITGDGDGGYGGGLCTYDNTTTTTVIATVDISNSTISDNKAANGGGVYSAGTLTVNNCTITGCEATDNSTMNSGGGGILSSSTLVVNNSTISYNKAAYGGGILASSTTTVNGCDFLTNECNDGGSGFGGGGLCVKGTTTLQGTNTFTGNYGIGVGDGVYICSGSLNAGSSTLNINDEFYNWWTSTFIYDTSTVVYGGESQSISKADAPFNTYLNYYNLTLNGTGEHIAYGNFTVNNNLVVNTDINLNGKIITLGETATLSENTGICKGTSGTITTTRTFDSGITSENVAGLGAEITTSANMESTIITRGIAAQSGGGSTGIKRYYDITPTINTGLDATLVFHYDDDELNGRTESSLGLWKSTDSGTSWTSMGGSVDTDANAITLSGISGFSRWTATDADNSLPVTLSAFTAQYIESIPVLCWTTQSETSNAGWNVYRSETDIFEEAIQINLEMIFGAGTTSEPIDYIYEDESELIENTEYWYWLESIDYSGLTESYGPISLIIPEDGEEPGSPEVPGVYGLHQNFPNPFNPNTEISFMMKESCIGQLSIFNIKGQKIKILFSNKSILKDELVTYNWNGKDESGKEVSTGVYYYKLRTDKRDFVRKMSLLK